MDAFAMETNDYWGRECRLDDNRRLASVSLHPVIARPGRARAETCYRLVDARPTGMVA